MVDISYVFRTYITDNIFWADSFLFSNDKEELDNGLEFERIYVNDRATTYGAMLQKRKSISPLDQDQFIVLGPRGKGMMLYDTIENAEKRIIGMLSNEGKWKRHKLGKHIAFTRKVLHGIFQTVIIRWDKSEILVKVVELDYPNRQRGIMETMFKEVHKRNAVSDDELAAFDIEHYTLSSDRSHKIESHHTVDIILHNYGINVYEKIREGE